MFTFDSLLSFILAIIVGLSCANTWAGTREHLELLRRIVLLDPDPAISLIWSNPDHLKDSVSYLASMTTDQTFPMADQLQAQKILAESLGRARQNLQAMFELRKGLETTCRFQPAHLLEDTIIMIYGGWINQSLSRATTHLHLLVGHCDPRIRKLAATWLQEKFEGNKIGSAIYPGSTVYLDGGWIEELTAHQNMGRPSPIGKALARLAYNAQFDPDQEVRRFSMMAWNLIENSLRLTPYGPPMPRYRVARQWLAEIQEIHQYWYRQRAALRTFTDELTAKGEDRQIKEPVGAMLRRARYGDTNLPPLPACQELFYAKRILN